MAATGEHRTESTVVEQPAGVEHRSVEELQYVGIGRRAVGIVVDGVVLTVAYAVLGALIGSVTGGTTATGFSLSGGPAFLFFGLSLLVGFGYFTYLEGTYGTTLGKRLVGLTVVMEDGTPCTVSAAAVRTVLRIVDGLFFYLVGAILVVTSSKKQRLGDRIADTVVVRR